MFRTGVSGGCFFSLLTLSHWSPRNLTMTSDGNGGIVLDGQFQNPVVEPWAQRFGSIRGFPYMEVSENGRFTENPIKMDD